MKVVDMHCDTISEMYERRKKGWKGNLLANDLHVDLGKMEKGDYLLQNFALFTNLNTQKNPLAYGMKLVDVFYEEIKEHSDKIGMVRTWQEIEENRRNGKMSALLTLEEGGVCMGELGFLRDFYRLGVRMMTLTWNVPNELGYPSYMPRCKNGALPNAWGKKREEEEENGRPPQSVLDQNHGLTKTGIEFVQEMERIGMIIDISHLNDRGIWDVFQYTKKPFVASHSNARALANHPRNLTDEMIRQLAERGGVAGINFCASFLRDEEDGKEPIHSQCCHMVAHMKHMKQVGGIGCIGLGSDFDGITSIVEIPDCSAMGMLADEMNRQGFTLAEMEAVFFGNVLRLYRELL